MMSGALEVPGCRVTDLGYAWVAADSQGETWLITRSRSMGRYMWRGTMA